MGRLARKSIDPAANDYIGAAMQRGISTAWERYALNQPQCGFGSLGLCCHDCLQGPCRIDPFGDGSGAGICGRNANQMTDLLSKYLILGVSERLSRVLHLCDLLLEEGSKSMSKPAWDVGASYRLARELNLSHEELSVADIGVAIGKQCRSVLSEPGGIEFLLQTVLPNEQISLLTSERLISRSIMDFMAQQTDRSGDGIYGRNTLRTCRLDAAVVNLAILRLENRLTDIVNERAKPRSYRTGLDSLNPSDVNVLIVGDVPERLPESIRNEITLHISSLDCALMKGVKPSILGVCTDSQVDRIVANYGSQELLLVSGMIDAVILGYGCANASMAGLTHRLEIPSYSFSNLDTCASGEYSRVLRKCAEAAIGHSKRRAGSIAPDPIVGKECVMIGAGAASIGVAGLIKEGLISGAVNGIALVVGCNNIKTTQDLSIVEVTKGLLRRGVLCFTSGCASVALGRAGMLDPKRTHEFINEQQASMLREICREARVECQPPAVISFGSCTDSARFIELIRNILRQGQMSISDIPAVVILPELSQRRLLVDGLSMMVSGLPVVIPEVLPIWGSDVVPQLLMDDAKRVFRGGLTIFDQRQDPIEVTEVVMDLLKKRLI